MSWLILSLSLSLMHAQWWITSWQEVTYLVPHSLLTVHYPVDCDTFVPALLLRGDLAAVPMESTHRYHTNHSARKNVFRKLQTNLNSDKKLKIEKLNVIIQSKENIVYQCS